MRWLTPPPKPIAAICGVSDARVSCFVAPDDSGGRRARAVALPVGWVPAGSPVSIEPTLSVAARVALDNAMLL